MDAPVPQVAMLEELPAGPQRSPMARSEPEVVPADPERDLVAVVLERASATFPSPLARINLFAVTEMAVVR
jgi:hypothetical protein